MSRFMVCYNRRPMVRTRWEVWDLQEHRWMTVTMSKKHADAVSWAQHLNEEGPGVCGVCYCESPDNSGYCRVCSEGF